MLSQIRAVIFDLDGLVLDTEHSFSQARQSAGKQLGFNLSENFCTALTGLPQQAINQQLQAYCGKNLDLEQFNHLCAQLWYAQVSQHGIAIKHGFIEFMAWLALEQIPVALATNSHAIHARFCLQVAGLANVFTTLLSADDVRYPKPAPDIFLAAALALQIPISECLVLEDSPVGIIAACRAGAKTAFIPSSLPADKPSIKRADSCYAHLAQLHEQWQALQFTN